MAVDPVLASALWQAEELKHRAFGVDQEPTPQPALSSGCRTVDQALVPGLSYGNGGLCCVSCEPDAGGPEYTIALLITHLSHAGYRATLIDSQGVDLLALYGTIKARLLLLPYSNPNLPPRDVETEAKAVLDRLRITRVFSFEGLLEALAEFRSDLEHTARDNPTAETHDGKHPLDSAEPGSSGADDEGDAARHVPQHASLPPAHNLLLVSSLSSILLPVQRVNYTHANALLTSLLRSLRHVARTYNTAIIATSGTSPVSASFRPTTGTTGTTAPSSPPAADQDRGGDRRRTKLAERSPSIFASCSVRPAFGAIIDAGADVHLLLFRVPRSVDDAKAVYGAPPGTQTQAEAAAAAAAAVATKRRDVKWVSCVEVLADRQGGRLGRFGFFAVGRDGLLRDGPTV